jgi:hypothetical protein
LPALVSQFAGCDLLLYGAGTDAYINAPLPAAYSVLPANIPRRATA